MLCCVTTIFAQNDKISYQAVVRDPENKLVANKTVKVLHYKRAWLGRSRPFLGVTLPSIALFATLRSIGHYF